MKDHWGPVSETTKNAERPKDALAVLCGLWRRFFPSPVLTRLAHDRRGVIIVMFALLLPVLLGFIGLGVEVVLWFQQHRDLQSVADAASVAGVYELRDGNATATIKTVAQTEAARNGLDTGSGDTISVNLPPTSGSFTASSAAVEVVLTKQVVLLFAGYFLDNAVTINARAVATTSSIGDACILSLNPSADSALLISGNINLVIDCDLAVSSSSSKGFDIPGTSTIDANKICVKGSTNVGGNVTFPDASPTNGCNPPSDPLSGLAEPPEAEKPYTCPPARTNFAISGNSATVNLTPGVYCNGINISGNSNTINFAAGTFVLAGGNGFNISGANNTINADGVTFYTTDNNGDGNYANVNLSGNNTFNISAPDSGDYAGILFYNDSSPASASSGKKFNASGNSTFNDFDGVVYFPNHEISFSGNTTSTSSCGPKLLSDTVKISGNIDVYGGGSGCAGDNVNIGSSTVVGLVE